MGLKEKLLTKERPRTTLRVQTSEIEEAQQQALADAQAAVLKQQMTAEVDEAALQAALDHQRAVEESIEEHFVDIELQAATPAEIERVVTDYPSTEETKPGQTFSDGGMDWKAALPVLLALGALDEDLQDVEWWREYLERPVFSEGELLMMWRTVLLLNMRLPRARIPKG